MKIPLGKAPFNDPYTSFASVENKDAIIYVSGCFDKEEKLYNKTFE